MELKVINEKGQSSEKLSASDEFFGRAYNEDLVHQLVTAYMAMHVQRIVSRKRVARLLRVLVSHSSKRERVVRVLVWLPVQFGEVAARYSRTPVKKIILRRLTVKCIVLDWLLYSPGW